MVALVTAEPTPMPSSPRAAPPISKAPTDVVQFAPYLSPLSLLFSVTFDEAGSAVECALYPNAMLGTGRAGYLDLMRQIVDRPAQGPSKRPTGRQHLIGKEAPVLTDAVHSDDRIM